MRNIYCIGISTRNLKTINVRNLFRIYVLTDYAIIYVFFKNTY